jgi:metal-responsive CopG/Arc/MetJ family transcriptional regulator
MKTAISIPDPLFEEAERIAKRRGMSRSELYSRAVAEYVRAERFLGVRERLDAVYQAHPEDSRLDPFIEQAQARSLPKKRW